MPGPALDPAPYDLVCVTSPNAADELFARLLAGGRDARALAGARIASIGPGTTRALLAHGIAAEIEPPRFVAEGLAEALAGVPGQACARGAGARWARAAARRAARARHRGRRARPLRDRRRAARRGDARARARRPTTHVHVRLDRAQLPRRRWAGRAGRRRREVEATARTARCSTTDADRLDRAGHQRDAARTRPEG